MIAKIYEIKKLIEYCELNEDKSCYEFYKFNKFPSKQLVHFKQENLFIILQ